MAVASIAAMARTRARAMEMGRLREAAAAWQRSSSRSMSMSMKMRAVATAASSEEEVILPKLPYEYNALEPVISGEIMMLHHDKHHAAYVSNFNKALHLLREALAQPLSDTASSAAIVSLYSDINFNGGGHINHSFFWKILAPVQKGGGEPPKGNLASAINEQHGSLDALIQKMSNVGAAVQGSGWVWLGLDKELKRLVVDTTSNQDPLVTKGLHPIVGIDVWEHAYYLQYKNARPDYLKNIWKVINWKYAEDVFDKEIK